MTVRWSMPRDMSKFSTLEAAMLAAINAAGLPEPLAEYQFDKGCCGHGSPYHPMLARSDRPCNICFNHGIPHPQHVRMARRWRFDFAWPDLMLAVECEGGTWSGGRHTSGSGFEKDAEKYSEAAIRGWSVLRFTQRQIMSGEAIIQIERAVESRLRTPD